MFLGVLLALAAGLMWGLVFVGPVWLPDYPAVLHTAGRYLAFGVIALPLAWFDRCELAGLRRVDWWMALKLAAIGNLLYYFCLASAIQLAGAPLPTMIIGCLPLVIAICANLRQPATGRRLPWARLAPPLVLLAAGIACVQQVEWQALRAGPGGSGQVVYGMLLATAALICWTWYPLRNADWLLAHPERRARAWATAQGLATLPLAILAYLLILLFPATVGADFALPWGPRPLAFFGLMLAIGLFASWLGTLCWNAASRRLPAALVGQLIVFETLAALLYAYLLRASWPPLLTWIGIALLLLGVSWGLRVSRAAGTVEPV
ncbi:DMT family transporter [Dechloromonas sp. ZY10]|uniref:DMT family transporter n=1 Tax=Dechloromonas aquae TaxID=2664436 RepID=UPI0035276813